MLLKRGRPEEEYVNLIFTAYTHAPKVLGSQQLTGVSDDVKRRIYEKNILVALASAKRKNPEDEVALITTDMPGEPLAGELSRAGVKVLLHPFDTYVMPEDFRWKLAFYKLCALTWAASLPEYERILLLDSDTLTMEPYGDLWKEADEGLMLFPLGHTWSHPDRQPIRETYRILFPQEEDLDPTGRTEPLNDPIQYGGEFVCGRREQMTDFTEICLQLYQRILQAGDRIPKEIGDECILSIAAGIYNRKLRVRDACAYVYRYWTDAFYLVATNTFQNPVCIWHLPAEKDRGILYLYAYYRRHGDFPPKERTARVLGMPGKKRPLRLQTLMIRYLRKRSHAGKD